MEEVVLDMSNAEETKIVHDRTDRAECWIDIQPESSNMNEIVLTSETLQYSFLIDQVVYKVMVQEFCTSSKVPFQSFFDIPWSTKCPYVLQFREFFFLTIDAYFKNTLYTFIYMRHKIMIVHFA
nr:uncharacterized protein LOC116429318 [Nomia melanderi]